MNRTFGANYMLEVTIHTHMIPRIMVSQPVDTALLFATFFLPKKR